MSKKVREGSHFFISFREARAVLLPLLRYLLRKIPIHFSSDGDWEFCATLLTNCKPRFIPVILQVACALAILGPSLGLALTGAVNSVQIRS